MKQIIPFTKDITFKTKIGELISISLDNDLTLKGEDLVTGNFYIKGSYKMIKTSELEEEYSYKLPCDIAISEDYETFDATIDIENFNYEIVNEDILRITIEVAINNLEKKEITITEVEVVEEPRNDIETLEEELNNNIIIDDERNNPIEILNTVTPDLLNLNTEETYATYYVYLYKEEDTIDKIMDKYCVTLNDLNDYNDMEKVSSGMKIIIPCPKYDN